ncbi:FAD-dependent oxidoreductase [Rhodococcus rhodochrous]|nr:FAD-dependent oxidoreductase [Rhodococcus rhodochrous]MCB8914105.1 FAD-dependent oxidoreductase [Rhodococcus rhodochrous]
MHKVDLAETGGTAVLDDGTEIGFARLALATGSVPRALPAPGADLPGVLSLRTIDDAAAIRAELDRAGHVVVIGGGFVGLEVATAAAKRGAAVTVVEAADRILARVVAAPLSGFVTERHEAQGIRFRLGTTVAGLRANDAGASRRRGSRRRHRAPRGSGRRRHRRRPHRGSRPRSRPPMRGRHRDRRARPHRSSRGRRGR